MDVPNSNGEERIAALTRGKPYLRAYFAYSPPVPPNFRLEVSRDDNQIPTFCKGDRRQRLASAYAPGQEADRTLPAGRETWKGREIVLLLGLGNPLVPLRLLPDLGPGQIVLAVDAFFELGALLCREHEGFAAYLQRPGAHLFCGEDMLEPLWNYLDGLSGQKLAGLKVVSHRASRGLAPDFYDLVEERVKTIIKAKMSDLLTRFEFEKNWIRNIIVNSRHLPAPAAHTADQAPPANADPPVASPLTVRHWEGVLAGRPALLVAAGPSLRKSLDQVRALRETCFVLACDTAFKVLSRAGIRPHGVICLDAQKHSLLHFLGEDLSDVLFFCDIVVHPTLLRNIAPRAVIFSTTAKHGVSADGRPVREATPGTEHAERIHGGPIGDVQSGGSVATTGYDLLRILGARTIYLIGQDLAYTGRQIHCTGTHHNERWLTKLTRRLNLETINESVVRRRHTHPEPGITGQRVLADYVLDLYRAWFEDAIPRAGVETINLTADGARIDGAPAADARTVAERLSAATRTGATAVAELFSDALPLEVFTHADNRRLFAELARAVPEGGDFEILFERQEFLRTLCRRAETYVARNAAKLTEERAAEVYDRFVRRELKELYRGLRPYFAGGAGAS